MTATERRQQSVGRYIYFISIMTDWRTGSGSLTASKMRKQGSDRSAERLACTGQPDSLRYLAYAFSIPTTCIETTFISLEKGQMQIRFKQSYRKSISLSKLRTHRRRRDGHWYI